MSGPGKDVAVIVVGAGFGGIAAAIELKRAGYENFTILERGDGVGGVWRENHYPGAACDVPSVIYSYSYALKGNWSQPFGLQPEIKAYLEQVAREFDLERHLRLSTEVVAASYDDASAMWIVELADGEILRSNALVLATGQLSRPRMPDVPGLERFEGASFHSAEWDHDVDIANKRVAVVGSGASAIQIVPAIADQVANLTVVQRSPNWVIKKSKRRHGAVQRAVLRFSPGARRVHHNLMFLAYESRFPLVLRSSAPIRKASEWYYRRLIRRYLGRATARIATPDYTMLCNRLLLSNDWYPTLAREHVTLVGAAVTEVQGSGLVCSDGTTVAADVIVWCTGFKASEFLAPIEITGRDGAKLREVWADGAEAYLGMSVPQFPNLAVLFGPNTNSITNSIVFLLEKQARYTRMLVDEVADRGGAFDLRQDVHDEFQSWLDAKLRDTVFTDSCPGWYTNAAGKVTAMWPSSHLEYARRTQQLDPTNYEHLRPEPPTPGAGSTKRGPRHSRSAMPTSSSTGAGASPLAASMADLFQRTAAIRPDAVALRTADDSISITWADYAHRVRRLAAGLAGLGINRGDTVALMLVNRPEMHLFDTACIHLGATPFSVYNTSSAEQIAFIAESAQPKIVVTESQFLAAWTAAPGVAVKHIVCVDGEEPGTISAAEVEAAGSPEFDFDATWRKVAAQDVLTLIYTSGTTGDPKGVQITHANMLAELAATNAVMGAGPDDRILSFLPSAHIADRWAGHYVQIAAGNQLTCISDRTQLLPAMVDVRPTLFGGVPQMWQKFRAAIEGMIDGEPDAARRELIKAAIELGKQYVAAGDTGAVPAELEAKYRAIEGQVFAPMRERLGLDQARVVQSGAAPIPLETLIFFNAIGVPLTDVWGMSELSCLAVMPPLDGGRLGTVGKPIDGVEVALGEDGELLVRGSIVMAGYLGRPDLTEQTISEDGWLYTGDIGSIDEDGYVRIVDRKKELIINSSGKNMSPANIEGAVKSASSLIGQVVVIGNDRPYNVGLIVLEPEAAAMYASAKDLPLDAVSLAVDEGINAIVANAVEQGNARLSRVEQLKKFVILPEFWEPGTPVLTHTMKLRRRPISELYRQQIEELYS